MSAKKLLLYTLFIVIALSSCVTSKKVNYLQQRSGLPSYVDSVEFKDYQLQKGDYLNIIVSSIDAKSMALFNGNTTSSINNFNSDDSSSRLYLYVVGEDGCIDYPYVGKINVLGKTLREVKHIVEEKLEDQLESYSVEVRLSNRTFSIIGESGSGRYTIPREKLTIFEALAMSGDLSFYAKRSNIQIIRQTENGTIVKTFDIRTKSIIDSEFYYIQPNDVIYVPFQNAKYVGASNFTSVLSLTFTTLSFGLFIYSIVRSIINVSTPQ